MTRYLSKAFLILLMASVLLGTAIQSDAMNIFNYYGGRDSGTDEPEGTEALISEESVDYLSEVIAQSASEAEGMAYEPDRYKKYAERLAKTLSALSAQQQQEIIFGQ